MAIRRAFQVGEPVIRDGTRRVDLKNGLPPEARRVIRDLRDSMRAYELVGMAAPQVGSDLKIFVTELRKTQYRKQIDADPLRVFVNPRIVRRSRVQSSDYEGCGSVAHAGIFAIVPRSLSVSVEARDEHGKLFVLDATGLLARVIQHEDDHLRGVLFLDRVRDMRTLVDRDVR